VILTLQVLVFSYWPGALDVLGAALRQNDVPHVYGAGKNGLTAALSAFCDGHAPSAALKHADVASDSLHAGAGGKFSAKRTYAGGFNSEPMPWDLQHRAKGAPRVLLLPLKDAGAGLNLSEAQHVLLMEPSLSPAMEAQVCCMD
jgi:hypothetical protein